MIIGLYYSNILRHLFVVLHLKVFVIFHCKCVVFAQGHIIPIFAVLQEKKEYNFHNVCRVIIVIELTELNICTVIIVLELTELNRVKNMGISLIAV